MKNTNEYLIVMLRMQAKLIRKTCIRLDYAPDGIRMGQATLMDDAANEIEKLNDFITELQERQE
jgi:hypothetical protein